MKEQVRRVQQRRGLIGDCRSEARIRMAERSDTDAGNHVEIAAAIRVEQAATATALEDDRIALVDLQDMLGLECHHVTGRGRHASRLHVPLSPRSSLSVTISVPVALA